MNELKMLKMGKKKRHCYFDAINQLFEKSLFDKYELSVVL